MRNTIYYSLILLFQCCVQLQLTAQVIPYNESDIFNIEGQVINGKPSIASDSDVNSIGVWGTLDFNNPSQPVINMVVSNDRGKEWIEVQQIAVTNSITSPSIANNRQGDWVTTWRDGNKIYVIHSSDLGVTWSDTIRLNTNTLTQVGEPKVVSDKQNAWKVVWAEYFNAAAQLVMVTSDSGLENWGTPETVVTYTGDSEINRIPHITLATNGQDTWTAFYVLNRIDANYNILSDQMAYVSYDGIVWTNPTIIHECQHIRNIDLATDNASNWMLVWGEEDDDQSPLLRNKIYQAFSNDDGKTWDENIMPIRIGKYPSVHALEEEGKWSLLYAAQNFISGTGADYDIILSNSYDHGNTWEENALVNSYALEDNTQGINDLNPTMAQNETGAWIVLWVKNLLDGQQARLDIAYRIADSSAPFAVSVSSDQGEVTSKNDKLSFSWEAFIDKESGVASYGYAFGSNANPEEYQSFKAIELDDTPVMFTPQNFPNFFANFFPTGEYVFTIRATNNVGLQRDSSVSVCVRPLKIGEQIPLPAGKSWSDIDWDATTFAPSNHVVLIEDQELLLAADYVIGDKSFTINWVFTDSNSLSTNYDVASEAVREPMIIYHTHEESSANLTGAPSIDVSKIDNVILHYSTTVPESSEEGLKGFWQSTASGGKKALNARGLTEQLPAYILVEYQDDDSGFIGVEIVELRAPKADVSLGIVDIGSRVLPYDTLAAIDEVEFTKTIVFSGQIGEEFIYQHLIEGANQKGHIWAVKENDDESKARIIWRRKGLEGIIWPFQFREYKSPNWPTSEDKYQVLVRDTDADTIGREIIIPSELQTQLIYESVPRQATLSNSNVTKFQSKGIGWTLLKYSTGPEGADWVGFEVVKTVEHTDIDLFDLEEQDWSIGIEITEDTHEGREGGYVHTPEGTKFAPNIYEETEQIFSVNKDILEVWWANLSRLEDPEGADYPAWPEAYRVQWFSDVKRYSTDWTAESITDTIVIASTKGTGETLLDNQLSEGWEIYYQNSKDALGFNPNDEHALELDGKVFALRDDLGTEDASEPYVLIKYKDNLKYKFQLYEVIRETPEYRLVFEREAGEPIEAPYPINKVLHVAPGSLGSEYQNKPVSGPFFKDRKNGLWAKAAGDDGGSAEILIKYYYKPLESFYTETVNQGSINNEHIPWLDNRTGVAANIKYEITWPCIKDKLYWGETMVNGLGDIPSVKDRCSVDIIYQQSTANEEGKSLEVIAPLTNKERTVTLNLLPETIEQNGIDTISFPALPPAVSRRLIFLKHENTLLYRGNSNGDHYLLNVMTEDDRDLIKDLAREDDTWQNKIDELFMRTQSPVVVNDSDEDIFGNPLALTTGNATGSGYVTIVTGNTQDSTICGEYSAISLHILEVVDTFAVLGIQDYEPKCPFDERVTIRHKGDFGGNPEEVEFHWYRISASRIPDKDSPDPSLEEWTPLAGGLGMVDYTIAGAGLSTITDNYYKCRYIKDGIEVWSKRKRIDGWINRVLKTVDGFQQASYKDFRVEEASVIASMINKAGKRWNGDVPLNCDNLDAYGLIEIYETVLNRGKNFSTDVGINDLDANRALQQVATRLVDLYTLLGNEAFADATDPTISLGSNTGVSYSTAPSSIFTFKGMLANPLEENLALLIGLDEINNEISVDLGEEIKVYNYYNKLRPNVFSGGGDGQVAYVLNYNVRDRVGDGKLEDDANVLFPQVHGDAWGHYLMAVKMHYELFRDNNFTWLPQVDEVNGGRIDFFDEAKFATAAAAKAKVASEIVNLTYRNSYVENPAGQWQGYKDDDSDLAWGFDEWATRTAQGSYFDWVVGNAILPVDGEEADGIEKIDRSTVLELREVASNTLEILTKLDEANSGLNPLGVATNVIPFGISPDAIEQGRTHFDQMYERSIAAMNNAIAAFNQATNSTLQLRQQADNNELFAERVEDQEADYTNRLIEIFGKPYPEDIGVGGTYDAGYNGPDIYKFNTIDPTNLPLGNYENITTIEETAYFKEFQVDDDGRLIETEKVVTFHIDNTANRLGLIKPAHWGSRPFPGEIQIARSEILQAKGRLDRALKEYESLLGGIEDLANTIELQSGLNQQEINILYEGVSEQKKLNDLILISRSLLTAYRTAARLAGQFSEATAEGFPTSVGLANDVTAPIRGGIRFTGSVLSEISYLTADAASLVELDAQQQHQILQAENQIELTLLRQISGMDAQINQLKQLVRQEASLRLELYLLQEAIQQSINRYQVVLGRGLRLMEERTRFRKRTAANIQEQRYNDMAFRIFRNDALQKYRSQFDLAARYVYFTAKAYDYETATSNGDNKSGQNILTEIVKKRLIGTIADGIPLKSDDGSGGLASILAEMKENYEDFRINANLNNPDQERRSFSLRNELFEIFGGTGGDEEWKEKLRSFIVPNLFDLPEYNRYCIPIRSNEAEPAIVIPFSTKINIDENFFGNERSAGNSIYSTTKFSTKINSVAVHFSNYSTANLVESPYAYFIPVGNDIQLSPTDHFGEPRVFRVLDQVIPTPSSNITSTRIADDPDWLPAEDSQNNQFFQIRRFDEMEATHDGSRNFDDSLPFNRDQSLIGRSVWNTKWLLIIPASGLLNREEGLDLFIDGRGFQGGVTDIKLLIDSYSFSGW